MKRLWKFLSKEYLISRATLYAVCLGTLNVGFYDYFPRWLYWTIFTAVVALFIAGWRIASEHDQPKPSPAGFDAALIEVAERLDSLGAASSAYRSKLEQLGFSPTAAEMMAVEYQRAVVHALFRTPK
jgi:hypothetical protein